MTTTPHITFSQEEKEAIKQALPFPVVLDKLGYEMSRQGHLYSMPCPFHDERTPSFVVYPDHGYCYGCHESADIFSIWQHERNCDFPEAVIALANLAGVPIQGTPIDRTGYGAWKNHKPTVTDGPAPGSPEARTKPIVPPMRRLRSGEIRRLAELRGLDPLAVRLAAHDFGRVGYCDWPQWRSKGTGRWNAGRNMAPAWCVTDRTRWCFDFRRFDGSEYEIREGQFSKCYTQGTKKWVIGCEDIGARVNVIFTEGGPDHLAAYHFLHGFGLIDEVAVCGILGSGGIAEDCLPHFAGKQVRIMMQADEAKPPRKKGEESPSPLDPAFLPDDHPHHPGEPIIPAGWTVPSMRAAAKWTAQLTEAGAAVEVFSLYGLKTATGARVTDLNDLALCDAETLGREDVQDAFFRWDF